MGKQSLNPIEFRNKMRILCEWHGALYRSCGLSILDVIKSKLYNNDIEWLISGDAPHAQDLYKAYIEIEEIVQAFVNSAHIDTGAVKSQQKYNGMLHSVFMDKLILEFVLYKDNKELIELLYNKYDRYIKHDYIYERKRTEKEDEIKTKEVVRIYGSAVGLYVSTVIYNYIMYEIHRFEHTSLFEQVRDKTLLEYEQFINTKELNRDSISLISLARLFGNLGIDTIAIGLGSNFRDKSMWPYKDNLLETLYELLKNSTIKKSTLSKAKLMGFTDTDRLGVLKINDMILLEIFRRAIGSEIEYRKSNNWVSKRSKDYSDVSIDTLDLNDGQEVVPVDLYKDRYNKKVLLRFKILESIRHLASNKTKYCLSSHTIYNISLVENGDDFRQLVIDECRYRNINPNFVAEKYGDKIYIDN